MPNTPRPGHTPREKRWDSENRGPKSTPPGVLYRPRERRAPGTGAPQPLTRGKVREQLDQALRARERAEGRIRLGVMRGRDLGMSWAEIGRAIGMTGQGAGKRYGAKPSPKVQSPDCD